MGPQEEIQDPGLSAYGIFRDSKAVILGCFSYSIGISYSFYAELMAAMIAIELAWEKGWRRLWLEYDSTLVLQAFNSSNLVPWKFRNKWLNCLSLCKKNWSFRLLIFVGKGIIMPIS